MGNECCSSRQRISKAALELDQNFMMSSSDFWKWGDTGLMEELYDIMEKDTQTHINVDTRLLQDKITGENRFCKTIRR